MKHKLKITILSILFGLLFGIPVYADSKPISLIRAMCWGNIFRR